MIVTIDLNDPALSQLERAMLSAVARRLDEVARRRVEATFAPLPVWNRDVLACGA